MWRMLRTGGAADLTLSCSQMNMDYSICNALSRNSDDIDIGRVMYDIFCQWHLHIEERIKRSKFLSLPPNMKIQGGVGTWHIQAHKEQCYPRYSPHFIEGIGQIEGEIQETLWAGLNKIAGSTRHMSLSHRSEVIDKHMNDNNWKKLVGIVDLLCRRYREAMAGLAEASQAFHELDPKIKPAQREMWLKAERLAMKKRGKALDIYHVKLEKGMYAVCIADRK